MSNTVLPTLRPHTGAKLVILDSLILAYPPLATHKREVFPYGTDVVFPSTGRVTLSPSIAQTIEVVKLANLTGLELGLKGLKQALLNSDTRLSLVQIALSQGYFCAESAKPSRQAGLRALEIDLGKLGIDLGRLLS